MNYRNMQIDDHDAMMELWRGSDGLLLRDADSRDGIDRYLRRNPDLSFVALDGDELVGTIMAGHDGRRGYIQHVAVAETWRCQGVAGKLVELSLQALAREGIVKAHVHVASTNRSGREYWSRRGFTRRTEIELYSFVNGDNQNA